MTKEEAIEWLKSLNYCDGEETQEVAQAIDYAIKALEQQPTEDCVSRKRLMDNYNGVETPVGYRKVVDMEVIKALPSVTPTHGTCKDCRHCGAYNCGYSCHKGHWSKISKESNYGGMGDFYCADFEKRGNENG